MAEFFAQVRKVVRVVQRDHLSRFDVAITMHEVAIERLFTFVRNVGGYMRVHRPWAARVNTLANRPLCSRSWFSIVSMNVNSLQNKLHDLHLLCQEVAPFAVFIQESRLPRDHPAFENNLGLSTYTIMQRPASSTCSGLLVAVSSKFPAVVIKASNDAALAVLVHNGNQKIILVCTYINPARKAADLELVADCLQGLPNVNCPIVVGGDFNSSSITTLRRLTPLAPAVELHEMHFTNSSLTHKVAGVPKSAIDYFLGNDCVITKAVRVLTDYDFSDHYPIFTSIVCNGWVQAARVHKPRLDRNKLKEASAAVRDSNYWAPLLTLMDSVILTWCLMRLSSALCPRRRRSLRRQV
eukprot:m.214082 g.214082  ORF g.214082 m.214082 type:complete len:353 (+) comp10143_c5_seq2:225-1283(+)